MVAALGQSTCLALLKNGTEAILSPIDQASKSLRQYAARLFAKKIDANPTRFLIPAMSKNGVTLESMAELYRQAGHVGAVPADRKSSAADLFERVRDRLYTVKDPLFKKQKFVNQATADLTEVTAVMEEVNRVQGLALSVRAYDRPDRSFVELAATLSKELDERRGTDLEGRVFAVFP